MCRYCCCDVGTRAAVTAYYFNLIREREVSYVLAPVRAAVPEPAADV